jgi:hypothetical protein
MGVVGECGLGRVVRMLGILFLSVFLSWPITLFFLSHLLRWIDGVGRLEKEKEAYKPGVVGFTSRLPPISLRWVIYLGGVACYIHMLGGLLQVNSFNAGW